MSTGTTLEFRLREGWTPRMVAAALVREWLPPFWAEPAGKGARWVVHSVVETPGGQADQLWEPGISTREYQERLERPDLCWAIRASSGRGRHTILARLGRSQKQPQTLQVVLCQASFPETLLDPGKLDQFLKVDGSVEPEQLFAALLTSHGFEPATT